MTSALICALLIGPVLLSAFLVVQIGQEGRAAVIHFREALPVWSTDNVTEASNGTLSAPGFVQDFVNQEWVREYRVQVRVHPCTGLPCASDLEYDIESQVSLTYAIQQLRSQEQCAACGGTSSPNPARLLQMAAPNERFRGSGM